MNSLGTFSNLAHGACAHVLYSGPPVDATLTATSIERTSSVNVSYITYMSCHRSYVTCHTLHTCTYIYIYVYICNYAYICTYVYMCFDMYVYIRIRVLYICIYVYVL